MSISQSLAYGLEILLFYNTSTPLFAVSEISKQLRYSESKTYRLVRTFIEYGLLYENDGTACYFLGLNALRSGPLAQQKCNISIIAKPFVSELSLLRKKRILLAAVSGEKGIALEKVESEEPIRYSSCQPGANLSLRCGASSKI